MQWQKKTWTNPFFRQNAIFHVFILLKVEHFKIFFKADFWIIISVNVKHGYILENLFFDPYMWPPETSKHMTEKLLPRLFMVYIVFVFFTGIKKILSSVKRII